jgi:hypothetical protein
MVRQAIFIIASVAIAAAPLLPVIAVAADAPSTAAAMKQPNEPAGSTSTLPLDLRTPPIEDVLTQAQIAEVLARTFAPRNIEGVEVDSSRMRDPDSEDYIPPGFAALFWATGNPSGLARLFMPQQNRPSRAIVDATRPAGPPPAIPAMAGEPVHYDR